jgi:hypothetical protein
MHAAPPALARRACAVRRPPLRGRWRRPRAVRRPLSRRDLEIGRGNLRATDDRAFKSLDYAAAGGARRRAAYSTSSPRARTCGHDVRSAAPPLARASGLYAEPPLGLLLLAAAVPPVPFARTMSRSRATFPGETEEVTAARILAHAGDQLGQIHRDYRRRVLTRIIRERSAWPF